MSNYYADFEYVTSGYAVGDDEITVDWGKRIINVPREGLSLLQSAPVEIRELALNNFRLVLKDMEDDENGMSFPTTHNHNTEVAVGGITLARVIEIINNYTITFEDGYYSVNLTGANSNVADRVNANKASVRSANSAGLIQTREIEHSSFNGQITIDIANGTAGTAYPTGTERQPVNNFDDASLIANTRGIKKIHVIGDANVPNTFGGFHICGKQSVLTFDGIEDSYINDVTVGGSVGKQCWLRDCAISGSVSFSSGTFSTIRLSECGLSGNVQISNVLCIAMDCASEMAGTDSPVFDMTNSSAQLVMSGYTGSIKLKNMSNPGTSHNIDLNTGKVILDSTVTGGTIVIRGTGELEDNSTGEVHIVSHYLTNPFSIRRNLSYLIESAKPSPGYGEVFYWNPDDGYDSNDGLSRRTAVKTFTRAQDLAVSGRGDIIVLESPYGVDECVITERVAINKSSLHLRGSGRNIIFGPEDGGSGVITIAADDCEIANFQIETLPAGGEDAVKITGDRAVVKDIYINKPSGNGIRLENNDGCKIINCNIVEGEANGVSSHDSGNMIIDSCDIVQMGLNGIAMTATAANLSAHNLVKNTIVHEHEGYGVVVGENVWDLVIKADSFIEPIGLGRIQDNGIVTIDEDQAYHMREAVNARRALETMFPSHRGLGSVYYWDPVYGDDVNMGVTVQRAVKTFARAMQLVKSNNNDTILIRAPGVGETYVIEENLLIDKGYVSLRGPGRDYILRGATGNAPTITLAAQGGYVSGMQVEGHATGTNPTILITGEFGRVQDVHLNNSTQDGILIKGNTLGIINNVSIKGCARDGVRMEDATDCKITNCTINSNAGNGITLINNTGISTQNAIRECVVNNNTGYQIKINSGVVNTIISKSNTIVDSGLGRISDAGSGTHDESNTGGAGDIGDASAIADAVWGGAIADHATIDTFGRLISDNLDVPVSTRAIGAGTGPFQSTIQIYATGTSTPLADVTIQIYNTDQSVLIASGVTNVAGQRFFALHGGSYKVRLYKSGVSFTVPETITVGNADSAHTLYGTALTINIPAAIDTCRVYEWCYRPNDSLPYPKINASARIVQLPYNYNGKLHGGDPMPTTYESATGMVYWDIVWGAKVEFAIRELDLLEVKYIPQVTTKRLYEIPSTTIPAATRPGIPDSKVDKYLK